MPLRSIRIKAQILHDLESSCCLILTLTTQVIGASSSSAILRGKLWGRWTFLALFLVKQVWIAKIKKNLTGQRSKNVWPQWLWCIFFIKKHWSEFAQFSVNISLNLYCIFLDICFVCLKDTSQYMTVIFHWSSSNFLNSFLLRPWIISII